MASIIGKKMTAYPPHAMNEQGGPPFVGSPVSGSWSAGLAKVGTFLTANIGAWRGLGASNPRFQWMLGGSILPGATNSTFSVQSASSAALACRLSMGNATWGTWYKDMTVSPGTNVLP